MQCVAPTVVPLACAVALVFLPALACAPAEGEGEGEGAGEGEGEGEGEGDGPPPCACIAPDVCVVQTEYGPDDACVDLHSCAPPAGPHAGCALQGDPCGSYARACDAGLACVIDWNTSDVDYPSSACLAACDPIDADACPFGETCAFEPYAGGLAYCHLDADVVAACTADGAPERPCADGTACDPLVGGCPNPAPCDPSACAADEHCVTGSEGEFDVCAAVNECRAMPVGARCYADDGVCDDVGPCDAGLVCVIEADVDDYHFGHCDQPQGEAGVCDDGLGSVHPCEDGLGCVIEEGVGTCQ